MTMMMMTMMMITMMMITMMMMMMMGKRTNVLGNHAAYAQRVDAAFVGTPERHCRVRLQSHAHTQHAHVTRVSESVAE